MMPTFPRGPPPPVAHHLRCAQLRSQARQSQDDGGGGGRAGLHLFPGFPRSGKPGDPGPCHASIVTVGARSVNGVAVPRDLGAVRSGGQLTSGVYIGDGWYTLYASRRSSASRMVLGMIRHRARRDETLDPVERPTRSVPVADTGPGPPLLCGRLNERGAAGRPVQRRRRWPSLRSRRRPGVDFARRKAIRAEARVRDARVPAGPRRYARLSVRRS
jgi:hypothetical protein